MSGTLLDVYNSNPATSMQSTDIMYLIRSPYANTVPGLGILWANVVKSLAPPQTTVFVDASNGSDSGQGTAVSPFQTILHALGTITTNSATKPFAIFVNGACNESSLPIKPFVDIVALANTSTSITIGSGNVTLDSSWAGNNNQTCTFNNITFASGTGFAIDFSGFTFTTSNTININNCNINGALGFTGKTGAFDNIVLVNTYCVGAVTITNCSSQSGSYLTTYNNTFDIVAASATGNIFWTSSVDIFYNQVTVSGTSSSEVILQVTNGSVQSTVTITATNGAYQYDVASWPSGGFTGIGFPLGKAAINVVQPPTVVASSSYNTLTSDYIINVGYAGAVSIIISNEIVPGQVVIIKDVSGMAAINNITITAASGGNIENASSYVMNQNLQSVTLICDANNNFWIY